MVENLYVHFPFCRRKCSYCALCSRAGVSAEARGAYVRRLAAELARWRGRRAPWKTVYFGGGTPALCELGLLAPALRAQCDGDTEFTVELHPLDVTERTLGTLADLGVNRISMGVQSLDDATLAAMGRGYTVDAAARAFARVKRRFDNAGIDLIVGYPGDATARRGGTWDMKRLAAWGLRHCSVYALQNERGLKGVPGDEVVMDGIAAVAAALKPMGLERYEISNFAAPGFACRHNLAVWRGEDYVGLGDGACGRIGLVRTKSGREETVSPEFDAKERFLFRLRTCEGIDLGRLPEPLGGDAPRLSERLRAHVAAGLLTQAGAVYRLTGRGAEVCDSILADLV